MQRRTGIVTPDGPACDHCHCPFHDRPCYIAFFLCHLSYCSPECLEAAEAERERQRRAEEFAIERHGIRHWKVVDGNGELVCCTLYKKGAAEVVRRLEHRRSPPFRSETGASARERQRAAPAHAINPLYRRQRRAQSTPSALP